MNPLDTIIQIIRENMVANPPGTSGGFSSSANPKGPVAGFDTVPDGRSKIMKRLPKEYSKFLQKSKRKI